MPGSAKSKKHFAPTKAKQTPSLGAVRSKDTARSRGVGESKNFGDPNARRDLDWSKLTMGGKPIMEYLWGKIIYAETDQGRAELEAANPDPKPRTSVTRDHTPHEEIEDADSLQVRFADDLADDDEFEIAKDPFEIPLRKYTPEGHHGVFLSNRKCAREGLVRNGMKYEAVLVPDPNDGNKLKQVQVGGMFLASVPERVWRKSQRYFDGLTKERMVAAVEKVQEQSDRVMGERGMSALARRRRVADSVVGIELDDPEQAAEEMMHESVGGYD